MHPWIPPPLKKKQKNKKKTKNSNKDKKFQNRNVAKEVSLQKGK